MKVTTIITTYNHEKFIAGAVNSVLTQEVKFDHEIILIEDCSTDRTREIVVEFQKAYPDKIRLMLAEKNMNDNRAFVQAIQEARGQYIAMLDGDDYWTSPAKLQRQVEFLDDRPDFTVCFHNVLIVYDDNSQDPWESNPPDQKGISTLEDLLKGCFIQTCSTLFRNGLIHRFPTWYYSDRSADWSLHIFNARHGKIGYIDEVMGVYRQHRGGVWTSLSKVQQCERIIEFYENINPYLDFTYDKTIRAMIAKHYYDLAVEREQVGDIGSAKTCLQKCVTVSPFHRIIPFRDIFKTWRRLHGVGSAGRMTARK